MLQRQPIDLKNPHIFVSLSTSCLSLPSSFLHDLPLSSSLTHLLPHCSQNQKHLPHCSQNQKQWQSIEDQKRLKNPILPSRICSKTPNEDLRMRLDIILLFQLLSKTLVLQLMKKWRIWISFMCVLRKV
ncbi:hypothetical protein AMTRI_Chr10g228260 [Amborella trichopoda]